VGVGVKVGNGVGVAAAVGADVAVAVGADVAVAATVGSAVEVASATLAIGAGGGPLHAVAKINRATPINPLHIRDIVFVFLPALNRSGSPGFGGKFRHGDAGSTGLVP